MARKQTGPMETQAPDAGPGFPSPMATAPTRKSKLPLAERQSSLSRSKAEATRKTSLKEQRSQLRKSRARQGE
jgi:hypothetical protein